MARPIQDPQVRITEILNAAESLFYKHGYYQTMVSDIVKEVGVSQGTFYYYFSSKEDIVEALISRHLLKFKDEIDKVAYAQSLTLPDKIDQMANIMLTTVYYNQGLLLEFLYNDQYLHLMDKLFRQAKKILAPYLIDVIQVGNREAIFHVSYPKETINYMLAMIQCYIEAIYEKDSEEALSRQKAMLKDTIKMMLGLSNGASAILDQV